MFRIASLKAGFAALAISVASALPAVAGQWVLVGEHTVAHRTDRDVFSVGWGNGRYDALRFRVIGNRVAVGDVKVYYGNGTSEHIDVREHLTPGQTTVAYDLKGVHRVIDRIEMLYQTDGSYGPRATMQVFGLRADHLGNNDWPGNNGHPGNTGWEVLGKQTVGLAVDHDTIRVGSELGKYRAIRLDVAGGNIQVYSVRVTFRNGEVQELPFDRFIYSGGTSGALDLHGHRRTIDRVDLVYKSRPSFRGIIPVVTVWGLH